MTMISKSIILLFATYVSTVLCDNTVYYCTDINWGGSCHQSPPVDGSCHNMQGGVAQYNDQISSFGPDPNLYCIIFRDLDCKFTTGGYTSVGYPGVADLRTIGFNDAISSYTCGPLGTTPG
ncbi:hypothetical protein BDN72DRAFT_73481 [Pluteus cervinus]|uniref:Uncharacterized protein n=1 Tax=Pluteus cervinus TaxID=181527 RepID=A0ACD3AQN9_9AGAR|nr:hypothetical protein BDN72DRAFT_73481 [Pluteus cervinus]